MKDSFFKHLITIILLICVFAGLCLLYGCSDNSSPVSAHAIPDSKPQYTIVAPQSSSSVTYMMYQKILLEKITPAHYIAEYGVYETEFMYRDAAATVTWMLSIDSPVLIETESIAYIKAEPPGLLVTPVDSTVREYQKTCLYENYDSYTELGVYVGLIVTDPTYPCNRTPVYVTFKGTVVE